ncbi:phage tail tape measure protein, partial [Bacillus thuringiensis]
DLQMALKPVLGVVADLVSKFAEWISNNPELAATLATIGVAIGVISGAIMALAPIVVTVMSIFGIGAAVAAGIVGGIPLIIAAIVAIGIAIYKNFNDIK